MKTSLYCVDRRFLFTNYSEILKKYGKFQPHELQMIEWWYFINCISVFEGIFSNIDQDNNLFDTWSLVDILIRGIMDSLITAHRTKMQPDITHEMILMYRSGNKIQRIMFDSSEEYDASIIKFQLWKEKVIQNRKDRKQKRSMYKNKIIDTKTYANEKKYYHFESIKLFCDLNCMSKWVSYTMNTNMRKHRNDTYWRHYDYLIDGEYLGIKKWWKYKYQLPNKKNRMIFEMEYLRYRIGSAPPG